MTIAALNYLFAAREVFAETGNNRYCFEGRHLQKARHHIQT